MTSIGQHSCHVTTCIHRDVPCHVVVSKSMLYLHTDKEVNPYIISYVECLNALFMFTYSSELHVCSATYCVHIQCVTVYICMYVHVLYTGPGSGVSCREESEGHR